jgi:hypothetical protein
MDRLSSDLGEALQRYAAIISTVQGSMPDVIDRALAVKHSRVKHNTFAQYAVAAKRLKEVFCGVRTGSGPAQACQAAHGALTGDAQHGKSDTDGADDRYGLRVRHGAG